MGFSPTSAYTGITIFRTRHEYKTRFSGFLVMSLRQGDHDASLCMIRLEEFAPYSLADLITPTVYLSISLDKLMLSCCKILDWTDLKIAVPVDRRPSDGSIFKTLYHDLTLYSTGRGLRRKPRMPISAHISHPEPAADLFPPA